MRSTFHTRAAVGIAVGTLLLSACSPAGTNEPTENNVQQSAGPATVEFWTINLKTNFNDYIQGLIDEYEAANPEITIDWVDVPGADITSRLLTAMASGDVPDAVNITSQDLDPFVDGLADLRELIDESELSAFQPSLIEPLERDGRLVAVPWYNAGPPVALYNTSLVDPVQSTRPTTWVDANALGGAVFAGSGTYGHSQFLTPQVFMSEGIDLLSSDRSAPAFNTPEGVGVLERWVAEYGAGIAPGVISPDDRQIPETLENGQVAFAPQTGAFVLNNIESNAPDIFEQIEVRPAVTGESGHYFLAAQQTFVVPSASDVQEAAADFIAFVTNADNQLAFCELVAIFPSTTEALQDPFFTEATGDTPQDQARQIGVETFDLLTDGALGTGRDIELYDALNEQIRLALTGDVPAADALTAAEDVWTTILAESD